MKVIDDQIYLEMSELEAFGIPQKTIYTGLYFNRKGKTANWVHTKIPDCKSVLILYDKIPTTSLKKLPTKTELLQAYLDEKAQERELLEAAKKIQSAEG